MKIAALYVYPVKSCQGVRLEEMPLDALGPAGDRRFVIVDAHGRAITQRETPELGRIAVDLRADGITLRVPNEDPIALPFEPGERPRTEAQVWSSQMVGAHYAEADTALTRLLGRSARLVGMAPETDRPIKPAYARHAERLGFADAYPILLLSRASLDGLTERVGAEMDVRRFRPNIVVEGPPAHDEDTWDRARLGDVEVYQTKLCDRCVLTTRDPDTGRGGKEPLKTLASYRRPRRRGLVRGEPHRAGGRHAAGRRHDHRPRAATVPLRIGCVSIAPRIAARPMAADMRRCRQTQYCRVGARVFAGESTNPDG